MNRPTLRQLEYAVAVDDLRSFSRAAEQLRVSQPGLSAQIAELEQRLGVVLFERGRTATRPTPAGAAALERARTILREADDLLRAVDVHRGTVAGPLRVAAIPTIAPYLLSAVARRLRQLWPDASIELSELRTAELVEAVGEGAVDMGLLATPVDTGALEVVELAFEPFVVAAASGHPISRRRELRAAEVADLDVLLLEDGHCLREHALAVCRLGGGARTRDVHHTGLSVLCQMVAAGDGVTFLPASAIPVEARRGSGLITRPLADADAGRTISLVWRPTDPRREWFAQAAGRLSGDVQRVISR